MPVRAIRDGQAADVANLSDALVAAVATTGGIVLVATFLRIAIAATRPESIYAIAHGVHYLKRTVIYKSTDAGRHVSAYAADPDNATVW